MTRDRLIYCWCIVLSFVVPVLLPAITFAAKNEEENEVLEARLEGYRTPVRLAEPGSNAFTWIILILLSMLVIGVMFKNAKRTHLD